MPLKMFPSDKPAPLTKIKNIVAIAAGKGGVGKSTVAVNLALSLHNSGYSVGLMDTDIYGPSIRKMLPEKKLPEKNGELIIPANCQGIKVITMAFFRSSHEAAAVRAPIANGIVMQFIKNVHWGELDFLLIDFPPGTGDIQLTLAQQANLSGAILVTTPQEVALLDVRKAAHLFFQVKIPVIGIVENMSYYQKNASCEKEYLFGCGGGASLASEMQVPLLGSIPVDAEISRCGDAGQSLFSQGENSSAAAQAFSELARNFLHHAIVNKHNMNALESFEILWKEMK